MRVSTKRALLITLAVIVSGLTIALWLLTAWLIGASLVHAIKPEDIHRYPYLVPWRERVEALPFDVVVVFEVVGFFVSSVATVIAVWLWHKATNIPVASGKGPTDEVLMRQRTLLLKNVNSRIDNTLDQQPYRNYFVDIQKELNPGSSQRPEPMPPASLPILEIFDRSGGWMLVLGAPGAGKSTTIILLAGHLCARAKQDDSFGMPAVFSLSSWDGTHDRLETWLIEQLKLLYDVRPEIAAHWIEHDALILLLDALDEAPEKARAGCVVALNEFRSRHSAQVVVSSRQHEYEETGYRLGVGAAIFLKPLTDEQIDAFVSEIGPDGQILSDLFAQVSKLKELAQNPFMLTVMATSSAEIATALAKDDDDDDDDERSLREIVISSYIHHAFNNTVVAELKFMPSNTVAYLRFLAAETVYQEWDAFHPLLAGNLFPLHSRHHARLITWTKHLGIATDVLLAILAASWLGWSLYYAVTNRSETVRTTNTSLLEWSGFAVLSFALIGLGIMLNGILMSPLISKTTYGYSSRINEYVGRTGFWSQVRGYTRNIYLMLALANMDKEARLIAMKFTWLSILCIIVPGLMLVSVSTYRVAGAKVIVVLYCFAVLFRIWGTLVGRDSLIRVLNARDNIFPWNVKMFLEECVKLKFLYRIGARYRFMHQLLLEHFGLLFISASSNPHLEDIDALYTAAKSSTRK